jgi:RHH-type transcriptional regulator, proline utilization regulon repressor / proline dehydrogenase / delta 1-pyrroline-5-carboxylate dehydrogenase
MTALSAIRQVIRQQTLASEDVVLGRLISTCDVAESTRQKAHLRAVRLVEAIRAADDPGLMEVFLAEYGLSTEEGVALMCLAEALLRVPDAPTMDDLIEDKIAPSAWGAHLGRSSSPLVNASTWALMITGKVLTESSSEASVLKSAIKRIGEPVIRVAIKRAMKELGSHFVLGETIQDALARGRGSRAKGYAFSYDMLGEAALTAADASAFFSAYQSAIAQLADACKSADIRQNPGISIKLSALHPRYEEGQRDRVMSELVDRVLALARMASAAGMGLNIDAEEADRLDLSLDVIEAVLRSPDLAGWDGFGVVVQAYGKRALPVIDWIRALAVQLGRKIMVRLVKGAYWDTEIKRAQVHGLEGFPVFTRKAATDISYICCARHLLGMTDRLYPQFATHNAHTVASILEMGADTETYEFQRLHGMGEALHEHVRMESNVRCRIYAPVGPHRDLLAYLVRRLLENGANSSFVNQIVNGEVPARDIAGDPFERLGHAKSAVILPNDLFRPERTNSRGTDMHNRLDLEAFEAARAPFRAARWHAGPMIAATAEGDEAQEVVNPSDPDEQLGTVRYCSSGDVLAALEAARPWAATPQDRATVLNTAGDLLEASAGEIFAILTREAGKTPVDCVAELREAVDFLRYYAARGLGVTDPARGIIACISPWNFPLAIFSGQIAAALAAGNGVLAKPAEPTGLIAALAVKLLHQAGVPPSALQLLPGRGSVVGQQITTSCKVHGVCFTGSTASAQAIHRAMAGTLEPTAPLIAETGGLNAMVVDSTALPEQAVKDILASAFQSAGQRCSALRMLYLQEDIAARFLAMLFGAMDELVVGDAWALSSDIGPIINAGARDRIVAHIERAQRSSKVLKQIDGPGTGYFVGPAVLSVDGILDLEEEVFGPVLHVATFKAGQLERVIADINATGYGLTFGIHSRIDDRVDMLSSQVRAGNIYVNRNQIGAIVGSQPFGGEGLSGTGPKAGGPAYVSRFTRPKRKASAALDGHAADIAKVQHALNVAGKSPAPLSSRSLPGPTGESNRLSEYGRGTILCAGPSREEALAQAREVEANGCVAVCVAPGLAAHEGVAGRMTAQGLSTLSSFEAIVSFSGDADLRDFRCALADRQGPVLPLLAEADFGLRCRLERHVCVDTTAAGGNTSLLAEAG